MSSSDQRDRPAHRVDAKHPLPRPAAMRFERSLNATGCTLHTLDEISQAFVHFAAAIAPYSALDVGAGFGVATLAALTDGATVIANDVEPRHLEALQSRATADDRARLTLMPGPFPDAIQLDDGSIGAVLMSRVLHFFDGPQIERSVELAAKCLCRGGKTYVICDASIFLNQLPLRTVYEAQLARGCEWPGCVSGVHALLPHRAQQIPDQLHYLDPTTLRRLFESAGFMVERADSFRRDCGDDGPPRHCTGIIARKL